jgi:hypothetical protein
MNYEMEPDSFQTPPFLAGMSSIKKHMLTPAVLERSSEHDTTSVADELIRHNEINPTLEQKQTLADTSNRMNSICVVRDS